MSHSLPFGHDHVTLAVNDGALEDIETILNQSSDLQSASEQLIQAAKIKGSSDNMTVLLIQKNVML